MSQIKDSRNFKFILLIIFIGIIVYGNSFRNEFVWDDNCLIIENSIIKSWIHIKDVFSKDIFYGSGTRSNFYRPLQTLSFMFDYSLWKLNSFGYHMTNLLFHISNAIIIYFLVNLISRNKRISIVTSLLFVVHPIHTEAVTYISGRADLIAALFFFLSFLLFIKYLYCPIYKRFYYYIGSIASFVLALLSKEAVIILPFILILYECCFALNTKQLGVINKIKYRYLSFFAVAGIYIFLRLFMLDFTDKSIFSSGVSGDLYTRFLTLSKVIISYIGLLFIPFNLHMERRMPLSFSILEPKVLISILLIGFILTFTIRMVNRSKIISFGSFWFFLTLLPVSNILPLNANMLEHWLYLPSVGFFMIAALGIVNISNLEILPVSKENLKRFTILFLVLILTFYCILTIKRNMDWRDELTFYRITLKSAPHSSRVHYNLGNVYFKKGAYEEGIAEYKKALILKPNYAKAHFNLGDAYSKIGQYENAISEYKRAIQLDPYDAKAHNNLGVIYKEKGLYDEAIKEYEEALKLNPNDLNAYTNLGNIYLKIKLYDKAIEAHKEALKIDPYFIEAHNNLGVIYIERERYKEAIDEFEEALRIKPDIVESYVNLGIAYAKLGEFHKAKSKWKRALELNPNLKKVKYNLKRLEQMGY